MTPGLVTRLQDIPGVETVSVDLGSDEGTISLRIRPDADEAEILNEVHTLLVGYGVKGLVKPNIAVGCYTGTAADYGLDVVISPTEDGCARIQVSSGDIQSSRQVAATPKAIAQGLADAWCQVSGTVPREVVSVSLSDMALAVIASDGAVERRGVGDITSGWSNALTLAVGSALGFVGDNGADQVRLAPTAW